jgi:chromosome segregation ATPase
MNRIHIVLGGLVLATAFAAPANAQNPPSQEDRRLAVARDALRQSQQALQTSENQRVALEREKQALAAERDALKADLAERENTDRARQGRSAQELRALRDEATTLRSEAAAQGQSAGALKAERDETRKRLATAESQARDRQQLNERLAALLERSTAALAEAEAQNERLLAAGERILDVYRSKTPGDANLQWEPLLGLGQARVEARAEALRRELYESRRAAAAAGASSR